MIVEKTPLSVAPAITAISPDVAQALDKPNTNVARINAVWDKWLNVFAGPTTLYIEPAVRRYDIDDKELPDLVVCSHDLSMKAIWKVVYEGRPGGDNSDPVTGPPEEKWAGVRDYMKVVCRRHKDQSPRLVITTIGRWVRFWQFVGGELCAVVFINSVPTALSVAPPNTGAVICSTLDVGNVQHIGLINVFLYRMIVG
jgi:hypothetical protein